VFDKFERLSEEKQKRIINAVIKELANKGYKQASTDIIAKEAVISKGALFNYFNNKKGMFRYVFDYSVMIILEEFYEKIDVSKADVIERYKDAVLIKLELMNEYPDIFNFFTKVTLEDDAEINSIIEEKINEVYKESFAKLFSGLDMNIFKEGIDIQKAINIIIWSLKGYSDQLLLEYKKTKVSLSDIDNEKILNELNEYLELLKKCLYK